MNAFALARQSSEPRFLQLTLPRQLQHGSPDYQTQAFQKSSPSSPSQRLENGAGEPTMRAQTIPHNRVGVGERVPSKEETRKGIKGALTKALPQYKITAKEIADKIGAQDATVEGWRHKPGVMSAEYLIMLGVAYPEFWVHVRSIVEGEMDLDSEVVFAQLRRLQSRGDK